MKRTRHTDAMRALSDLYRIEAERIETAQDVGSLSALRAQLETVQSDRAALESDIRGRAFRLPRKSGVPRETAWKILTATFACAGLAGFLTALWSEPAPVPFSATLAPSALPRAVEDHARAAETESNPDSQDAPTAASATGAAAESRPGASAREATRPKRKEHAGRGRGRAVGRGGGSTKPAKPMPRPPKPSDDGLGFFDDCGLDPMCGFDKKRR